jgi:Tfp pilus assembly protein PilF
MSLLLKALENAAKNRENPESTGAPAPVEAKEGGSELTLEPMGASTGTPPPLGGSAQPRATAASSTSPLDDAAGQPASRGASPQRAQTVLRAGAPKLIRPTVFTWFAQRPLVSFCTAAGLFAVGYGAYLYVQLTNPGLFVATSGPAKSTPAGSPPPPPPQVTSTPTPAPALNGPGGAAPSTLPNASALPNPSALNASSPAAPASAPVMGGTAMPVEPAPAVAASPSPGAPASAMKEPPSQVAKLAPAAPNSAPKQPAATPSAKRAAPPQPRAASTPAMKPAPADGITPTTGGRIVPVNATLVSAHRALEQGQFAEAERQYRQSLSAEPRSVDAMLGLAAALAQQNKSDSAAQYYVRVLEQEPRNAYAQAGLLNLTGRADPAAAETRLKQLIGREPSAYLYFSLGNLYADQGQWAGAQAAYFQAYNLAPDNPDYAFNLAVGLEHISQPKIALNYYRQALTLAASRGHSQFDGTKVQARIRSLETALADKP